MAPRRLAPPLAAALTAALLLLASPAAAQHEIVEPPGSGVGLPFSPGLVAGDFLFLSGAIGNLPGTIEVPGDLATQIRRTFDNLGTVLEAAGMDLSRVVAVEVYLADARDFPAFREVYGDLLPPGLPVRTTVEAAIAIRDARAEIAMVAARPGVEIRPVVPKGWKDPRREGSGMQFSWGLLAGDRLFVAGMVGTGPGGEPVAGGAGAQTRQALANVGAVLEAAGMGLADVASCRVFVADARDFAAMNEAWSAAFPASPPARATVQARPMRPELLVEIQCTAVKGERKIVTPRGDAGGRPFSPGVLVADRLFVAGMVGRGADGKFPPGAAAQTRATLERVRSVLEAAGMGLADVRDVWVILSDVRHYAAMNEAYREMMGSPPPARATVGAPLMALEALVEIQVTASPAPRRDPEVAGGESK